MRKEGDTSFRNKMKGGVNMKPASFETAIRLQFDNLARRVVFTTVKDYEKEMGRKAKREVPFSEIPEIITESFATTDDYDVIEKIIFSACGIPVSVQEGELAEALKQLPEAKRNVLLLSYFEQYPDSAIAKLMDATRNGIFKRRQSALKLMKEILQEEK